MPKRNILVIDDERTFKSDNFRSFAPYLNVIYAHTFFEALEYLLSGMHFAEVWLDHDLGGAFNGTELANTIETYTYVPPQPPQHPLRVDAFIIHSANPVGRKNMKSALEFLYKVYEVNASDFFEVK